MRILWLIAFVLGTLHPIVSPPDASADSTMELRVVELVNVERARHGLPALTVSPELTRSARAYGEAMANGGFFGHVDPDGATLVTRNEAAGYHEWTILAENLAAGQTTAEQAMNGWMNSPAHRAIILSPDVQEIGVGHVVWTGSQYVNYWVQEFGARQGGRVAAPPVSVP